MEGKSLYRVSWEEAPFWLRCLGVFALTNFFSFCVGAMLLGGVAVNGVIRDGHYFLRSHAQLREVSAATFSYSRVHYISAMIGIVVLMMAGVLFNYRKS